MARVGSIKYQVKNIIKEMNGSNTSKLEHRNKSGIRSLESGHKISDKIHSYGSMYNTRIELMNLGKFAKDNYGIKDIKLIDKNVIRDFIKSKDITYNTASNKLSIYNKVDKYLNISKQEVKELRKEFKESSKPNELKSRATRDLNKLEKLKIHDRSQPAFELQRDYGLRMNASTHINIDKQLDGNMLKYQEKGGKWSEIRLNPTLVSKIKENAVNGKYSVPKSTYSYHLKQGMTKAGLKYNGTHGLRHTFAQTKIAKDGWSKKQVSKALGHSREEITNTYLR